MQCIAWLLSVFAGVYGHVYIHTSQEYLFKCSVLKFEDLSFTSALALWPPHSRPCNSFSMPKGTMKFHIMWISNHYYGITLQSGRQMFFLLILHGSVHFPRWWVRGLPITNRSRRLRSLRLEESSHNKYQDPLSHPWEQEDPSKYPNSTWLPLETAGIGKTTSHGRLYL